MIVSGDFQKRWYQRDRYILLLIILLFPVGLFLLIKYGTWSPRVKVLIATIVLAILVASSSLAYMMQSQSDPAPAVETPQQETSGQEPALEKSKTTSDGKPIPSPTNSASQTDGFQKLASTAAGSNEVVHYAYTVKLSTGAAPDITPAGLKSFAADLKSKDCKSADKCIIYIWDDAASYEAAKSKLTASVSSNASAHEAHLVGAVDASNKVYGAKQQ